MYVTAIVLAAGRGVRLSRFNSSMLRGGIPTRIGKVIESGQSRISKPLIEINSQPIIIYCLKIFSKHPYIRDIIAVVNTKNLKDAISKIKRYRIKKIRDVVLGGKERGDSVICGLKAIDARTDLVLIHDAARPFIDKDTVSRVIKEAQRRSAAIAGVPVRATIKKIQNPKPPAKGGSAFGGKIQNQAFPIVEKTLDRNRLWEIQTPQVFKKDLILEAYNKFGDTKVTDDASLVERLGVKVKIVPGSYFNIKITTPEDLLLAEAISKKLVNNS